MNRIKKISAFIMSLVLLFTFTVNVSATQSEANLFDLPSTMSEGGNSNDGYTLIGTETGGTVAAFKEQVDITTQSVQFKTAITNKGNWDFLSLTNTDTKLPGVFGISAKKEEYGAVAFRLAKVGENALGIYAFTGSSSENLATIESFDFNVVHTYGFDCSDGKWWFIVDGKAVADLSLDDYIVTERLNKLSEAGRAYVQLASYGYAANFSQIKVIATPFNKLSSMTAGGSKSEGYTLTGPQSAVASFKQSLDIITQSAQLKTTVPGRWDFIAFTNTENRLTGLNNALEKEAYDAVTFRLVNTGDKALSVYAFTGAINEKLATVEPFDFTVAHTYGFKSIDGKWWLTVDEKAVANLTTNDDPIVDLRLDKLSKSGNAFLQLASYTEDGSTADFSEIKVVETPFNMPNSMTAGGNKTDGYTLTGTVNSTISSFKKALDIKYQSIQLKTVIPGAWNLLAFTSNDILLPKVFSSADEKAANDAVIFRLVKAGYNNSAMAIYSFSCATSETKHLCTIEGFDYSVSHIYGFKRLGNNWWLTVDGNAVADLTLNDNAVVSERLDKFSENGIMYVQLASYEGLADFSEININTNKSYQTGDSNNDNEINLRDLVSLKKKIALITWDMATDDLDRDEKITSVDLSLMRRRLLFNKVFKAEDYGAVANDGNDDAQAIREAIKAASEYGFGTVELSQGTYNINSVALDTPENTFHTLYFSDIHGVTITGNNTTLMVDDPFMDVFYFTNSSNVSIREITIDYSIDPWVQGTVTDIDQNSGTFTLSVSNVSEKGTTILDDSRWIELTTSRSETSPFGMVRDDDDPRMLKSGVQNFFYGFLSPKKISDGVYEIGLTKDTYKAWLNTNIVVGSKIVLLNRIDSVGAFRFRACTGTISVEDCNVYASVGTAFCIGGIDGNVNINNVHTIIKPDSGRWLTTNADGMYMSDIKGAVKVTNSTFEGLSDDAINLFTSGCVITKVTSSTTINVVGPWLLIPKVGEKITVIDPVNGDIRGEATVTESKIYGTADKLLSDVVATLTLDIAIEGIVAGTSLQNGDVVINQSLQAPGTVIMNNTFRYGRTKGVKLNVRDGKIYGNTFENLGYAAVNLHDIPALAENAGAYNVTVENNKILNCGYLLSDNSETSAAITVSGMCVDGNSANGYIHSNIDIKNNIISNVYKHGIYISSAKDVVLENNIIRGFASDGTASGMSGITLENVSGVQLNNMTIKDTRTSLEAGIRLLNNCNDITYTGNSFTLATGVSEIMEVNVQ